MSKTIHDEIKELLEKAVWEIAPGLENLVFLSVPDHEKFGDYATNVAFLLAPKLKNSPRQVAAKIVTFLPADSAVLEKVEIAGNGFINFFVSAKRVYEELEHILTQKENYGFRQQGEKIKILIEFVSANPTGPLHVGHGRGAATGDTLARIYQALGFGVQKEYYVNNVGNQMNILGASVQARYEGKEIPQDGYKGEYIGEIAIQIANDKIQITKESDFREYAIKTILEWIKKDLEDFGVEFDTWFYESDLYKDRDLKQVLLEKLKEYVYEQEGAWFVRTTAFGDDKDRVIFRSDGRPTYFASDIAYHENKLGRGFDRLIDIWGADHHGYVQRMKAAMQALALSGALKLEVILYQLVSLKRGAEVVPMSTRSGEFVTLREVLDEVGRDACRFFFLMRSPDSPLDFDLELAKKHSNDNPVYYVQYAYARICSIFREAAKNSLEMADDRGQLKTLELLRGQEEMELIKKLASFSKVLSDCARTYDPHWLTIYLQELASIFHNYYTKYRVISEDKDLSFARLALLKAIATILQEGLNLLGVSAPEKM